MRGVTVIGTGLDSGEIPVASAAAAATGGELFVTAALGTESDAIGGTPSERTFRTAASPAIAAGHAGSALDPAKLVAEARASGADPLVVAAPGGLMAPLTEHYSNRDLARELGFPLVIAARALPGVAGHVRLAGEAARAAGLAVAAVVLTGWPDPPNRVQLDERALLTKLARVGVFTLADSSSGADWPVADWFEAEPPPAEASAAAAPASAPAVRIALDDYDAWQPRVVGDPRNTPRPQIMQTMLEIIAAEGPMTATRAYSLYNRAAGGRKLTSVAKAPLSSAVYWLAREDKITLTREAEIPWQGDDMVRLPDQPAVRVRELGPRSLDEVPLDEIAELVRLIRSEHGTAGATDLKRAILSAYGLVRLTSRADEYLGLAIDLAD